MANSFVKHVYADHNKSQRVRDVLEQLLDRYGPTGEIINIGAGSTRLHPRIRNLEIEDGPNVDIVGNVTELDLPTGSVDLVITQEVLEHVADPFLAAREIHRVLRPGGVAYIQLPFVIGYHPCPVDYWRFTRQGIVELVEQAGFEVVIQDTTVGSATGFYRIAVEFFAILFSRPFSRLYRPAKGAAALLLYPIKLLDPVLNGHPEAHRIAGGFFVVARKPGSAAS